MTDANPDLIYLPIPNGYDERTKWCHHADSVTVPRTVPPLAIPFGYSVWHVWLLWMLPEEWRLSNYLRDLLGPPEELTAPLAVLRGSLGIAHVQLSCVRRRLSLCCQALWLDLIKGSIIIIIIIIISAITTIPTAMYKCRSQGIWNEITRQMAGLLDTSLHVWR